MIHVRVQGEDGAVTIIVAVFITVLFGFIALAVDVARLYEEKAQLESAADLSALAGSQLLWKSEADAEAAGETFVTANPTANHPGAYNEITGDLVDAKRTQEGTGCRADVGTAGTVTLDPTGSIPTSQYYDCVETKVQSPFKFLFASVLGFSDRTITTTSTSFMGNGAPRGTTIVPWLLRDCPNPAEYPADSGAVVPECPYHFTDSFTDDPNSAAITAFEEGGTFVGAAMPYESLGCPNPSGWKDGVPSGNSTYGELNQGNPAYTPCRIAPGIRLNTRGGNLGAQLAGWLLTRGISTSTCANAAAFNSALSRTGDGDGFVTIVARNPCLVQVSFVVLAAPPSRVPTVDDDVAGTPSEMQASIGEGRFSNLTNNVNVVVRRLAWYYITGYNNNIPIGVYLRAIDNENSILQGPMDVCPAGTPIAQCSQHGVYIVKLVN